MDKHIPRGIWQDAMITNPKSKQNKTMIILLATFRNFSHLIHLNIWTQMSYNWYWQQRKSYYLVNQVVTIFSGKGRIPLSLTVYLGTRSFTKVDKPMQDKFCIDRTESCFRKPAQGQRWTLKPQSMTQYMFIEGDLREKSKWPAKWLAKHLGHTNGNIWAFMSAKVPITWAVCIFFLYCSAIEEYNPYQSFLFFPKKETLMTFEE